MRLIAKIHENTHYDELSEVERDYQGECSLAEETEGYLLLGYSIWDGYAVVYEADSLDEAIEAKKEHENYRLYEDRFCFFERQLGYKIIRKSEWHNR